MTGAICGGPTLTDDVVPSPKGDWPEPCVLKGDYYRPGARCHIDGRYVSDVTALIGWATMGTFEVDGVEYPMITGHTIAAVVGTCKKHGPVEADFDHIEWGEYEG